MGVLQAFVFLREFVLGNNQTGLVTNSSGSVSVVGGESTTLFANDILPGQDGIFVGSGTTQSTYTYPSATIAAWQSFTGTAIPTTPTTTGGANGNSQSSAASGIARWIGLETVLAVLSVLVLNWLAA